MDKARHYLHVYLGALAAVAALLVAAPLLAVSGPYVEAVLLPVVSGMKATHQTRDGDAVLFHVEGTRHRPHCQLESVAAMATAPGSAPELVSITFPQSPARPGQLISRPSGFQSFGSWRMAPVNQGDTVQILLRHSCHSLWDITTRLGPWEVTR